MSRSQLLLQEVFAEDGADEPKRLALSDSPSESKLIQHEIKFIMHTSHYMVDLIYAFHYLSYVLDGTNKDIKQIEHAARKQLYDMIASMRIRFKKVIDHLRSKALLIQLRNVVGFEILEVLRTTTAMLTGYMEHLFPVLATQLQNCLVGFANCHSFFGRIPLQADYEMSPAQVKAVLQTVDEDIMHNWIFQLDMLNCKLFNTMAATEKIVERYRQATNDTAVDVTKGEAFKNFTNWIKSEIV